MTLIQTASVTLMKLLAVKTQWHVIIIQMLQMKGHVSTPTVYMTVME